MRKPRAKYGHGKDCLGRTVRWKRMWEQRTYECDECGHQTAEPTWHDVAPAAWILTGHDWRGSVCVRCGVEGSASPSYLSMLSNAIAVAYGTPRSAAGVPDLMKLLK